MNLLLIPGFRLDADLWTDMRSGLESIGRPIDADMTCDDTIAGLAERAIAVLHEPTIVIGFSMGGYVAREVAYRAPGKVAKLALIATSSRGHDGVAIPAEAPPFRQIGRAVISRALHPQHRSNATISRMQAMSLRLGNDVFRQQMGMARVDDTGRLSEIGCPTLIVAAAEDQLRSIEESRALHLGIPDSTLAIVKPSGHMIPIEQSDQLLALLRAFVS